ncbi:MAG: hypothetical protein GY870_05470 [archaeon]|nr:hypothetical protein [archaeon]
MTQKRKQKQKLVVVEYKRGFSKDRRWDAFWITTLILLFILVSTIRTITIIPSPITRIVVNYLFIGIMVFFILSMKYVVGGYSFSKDVISRIGRLTDRVTKKRNSKSVTLYFLFSTCYSSLAYIAGNLAGYYAEKHPNFTGPEPTMLIIQFWGYICAIAGIMMAIIPIDISRYKHLFSALIIFISICVVNTTFFIYLIIKKPREYFYIFITIIDFITCVAYAIGYLKQYHGALFQKICIIGSTFLLYSCIDFVLRS